MLLETLKIHDAFVQGVDSEYLTYDLEKLCSVRNTLLGVCRELLTGFSFFKEEEQFFDLKLSLEKMIELISKICSQLVILENNKLSEMSDETMLQHFKDQSVNLTNTLIALLDIVKSSSNLNEDFTIFNNAIKITLESYISECDKNVEQLKLFVQKGTLEDFGDIPNFSTQMEMTERNKKNLCEKLFNFFKFTIEKQEMFSDGVYKKLYKRLMKLLEQINLAKILPELTIKSEMFGKYYLDIDWEMKI